MFVCAFLVCWRQGSRRPGGNGRSGEPRSVDRERNATAQPHQSLWRCLTARAPTGGWGAAGDANATDARTAATNGIFSELNRHPGRMTARTFPVSGTTVAGIPQMHLFGPCRNWQVLNEGHDFEKKGICSGGSAPRLHQQCSLTNPSLAARIGRFETKSRNSDRTDSVGDPVTRRGYCRRLRCRDVRRRGLGGGAERPPACRTRTKSRTGVRRRDRRRPPTRVGGPAIRL